MEDKETINILIAQLLSKDDEILRLRNLLDDLQREQQSGNMQILSKLDRALEELKSIPAVRIMASSPPVRRMWWYITVMNRISLRVHAR